MEDNCGEKRWADGDDDEEALSLSDLPLIEMNRSSQDEDSRREIEVQTQEEFDFCSLSKESEMCAADEVFFQGQILPFRHSVSSERGLLLPCYDSRNPVRSESMDHSYSAGFISSRSSSIGSRQSSSSSSSGRSRPRLPPRIQSHSHPSPSPRIRFPTSNGGGGGVTTISAKHRNNSPRNSSTSLWNFLRVGLVTTPPEISFQDLRKSRCPGAGRSFGSRNSTGSSVISLNSGKKTKARRVSLFGGGSCRCASDAVGAVPFKVVTIKRSAHDGEPPEDVKPVKVAAKKQLSHHRTFEWLKQLSVEGAPDEA